MMYSKLTWSCWTLNWSREHMRCVFEAYIFTPYIDKVCNIWLFWLAASFILYDVHTFSIWVCLFYLTPRSRSFFWQFTKEGNLNRKGKSKMNSMWQGLGCIKACSHYLSLYKNKGLVLHIQHWSMHYYGLKLSVSVPKLYKRYCTV